MTLKARLLTEQQRRRVLGVVTDNSAAQEFARELRKNSIEVIEVLLPLAPSG
jgi:hypothetical protein